MAFLKRYLPGVSRKLAIMIVSSMLPLAGVLNLLLYGRRYVGEPALFLSATVLTFAFLAGYFLLCNKIANSFRHRFPSEGQNTFRIGLAICIFFVLSFLFVTVLFRGYALFRFFGYRFHDGDFAKAFACMIVINIFLTFLMEGVYRFEHYRVASQQTEQLKKAYMQSQLLGLKSQMNPHFLFNSLNSLSSLIQEDPAEAETFLDEMSKVYRYLLRNADDYLVPLETELTFIQSYVYLLKARHGNALQVKTEIMTGLKTYLLPPLTLQMIVENIITQNTISRNEPLSIVIRSTPRSLTVTNAIQSKLHMGQDRDAGLENISSKFRLLSQKGLTIETSETERIIYLPLIQKEEVASV
jgi:two-component system LytT family sensor kinase